MPVTTVWHSKVIFIQTGGQLVQPPLKSGESAENLTLPTVTNSYGHSCFRANTMVWGHNMLQNLSKCLLQTRLILVFCPFTRLMVLSAFGAFGALFYCVSRKLLSYRRLYNPSAKGYCGPARNTLIHLSEYACPGCQGYDSR